MSSSTTTMDTRQPVTKDKRKRANSDVNSVQTHSMETRSKAQNKRRKQETDPLKMGHILEHIFSFLDANSIKAARQVNPLWSIEGAKSLITKCYVKIPSELHVGKLSKKNTKMDKFKLFLSHKAKDFPVIPNIIVEPNGDVELWQSFGVLGYQVKSLSLKTVDYEAELLQNLLDLSPNLKYLKFEESTLYENRSAIIKVIISAMSKKEKDERSITISLMALGPNNEEELKEMEKLANCKNVIFEKLSLHFYNINASNFEMRITNAMGKILSTSQNVLKKLSLYSCSFYLSLIEFPCLPALIHIDLYFGGNFSDISYPHCKFSPSFRFAEKVPNLQEISTDYVRFTSANTEILKNLLENAGTAPSVKRVNCSGKYADCAVDALFKAFPNTEDLQVCLNASSVAKFRSLWTNGKNLKKLALNIDLLPLMSVPDLDFIFTGFDAPTVNKIKETPNLDPYTLKKLQKLRVNPSISNLKELEHLSIHCSDICVMNMPKRMLAVAAKYEISQLPKNPQISIICEHTHGLQDAFEEVSKLPNFSVQFENALDLGVIRHLVTHFVGVLDSDSDSD